MKEDMTPDRKNEEMETENIKPGGMTDGIMKEEAKTEVTNQRVKEDPETKDDILPEQPEPPVPPEPKRPPVHDQGQSKRDEKTKTEDIKPEGLTDGMMKEETKTEITNQKISEDPETVSDILPEDRGEK